MIGDRARWCQQLAQPMVDAELSIDAAARLWGLDRGQVQKLLRSDSVRRPLQGTVWLKKHKKHTSQQKPQSDQPLSKLPTSKLPTRSEGSALDASASKSVTRKVKD